MFSVTPRVSPVSYSVFNAEYAAQRVVELAREATAAGTFGVGGFLMDRSGHVFADAINAVIVNGELHDPTAHAERQLVDWFFRAQARGLAIAPRDVVIVSSLDPCAMCAGAILSAGFGCVALAEDSWSGIHVSGFPHRIPRELWQKADTAFGLFQVQGRSGKASHVSPLFSGNVSPQLLNESEHCFQHSLDRTRSLVSSTEVETTNVSSKEYEIFPENWNKLSTFACQLPNNVYLPDQRFSLADFSSHKGATLLFNDGCILVDEASAVLLAAQGREDLSPARSSVLELIRAYVWLRSAVWKQLRLLLPHQRRCSLIKLRAPSISAKAVMELGALGSFFENEHLAHQLPAFGFLQSECDPKLKGLTGTLPPFYTSIAKITIGHLATSQRDWVGPRGVVCDGYE
jgi:tRNA(Arg) A34 adenosine deaminase TadA